MFEQILLAVDGSASSRKAADVAADIGKKYGAEILVFHVLERQIAAFGAYDVERPDEATDLVDEIVRGLKDAGLNARGEVETEPTGRVPRAIVEAAKEHGAGLIVMGSRGLSEWEELFLGSVTDRVLHLAECPVLIVR
ncbi:MAG: universal stress protein [Actinomycetota bacterium]